MGFNKWTFKICKEKTTLKKEHFEVTEFGFKRGFDTFLLIPTMAIYRTSKTTEILPMSRTMEWILFQYKKTNQLNVDDLIGINKLVKRRF